MTSLAEPVPDTDLWFGGFFDDAALFPPLESEMAAAIRAHLEWTRSPRSSVVGPFVCTYSQWARVERHLSNDSEMRIALNASEGLSELPNSLQSPSAESRTQLASIEVAIATPNQLQNTFDTLGRFAPAPDMTVCVEVPVPLVTNTVCAALAERGMMLRLRTGGPTVHSFPTEYRLAAAIVKAVRQGVPFGLTPGLHPAVRVTDPLTQFRHHGFLNIMLATDAAMTGQDTHQVALILSVDSPAIVSSAFGALSAETVRGIRQSFVSLGSCNIGGPLKDLEELGLLQSAAA